jgi:hypothetical protein
MWARLQTPASRRLTQAIARSAGLETPRARLFNLRQLTPRAPLEDRSVVQAIRHDTKLVY